MASFYLNDEASTIMIDGTEYCLPTRTDHAEVNFAYMVKKFASIKTAKTSRVGNDYILTFPPFTNKDEIDFLIARGSRAYFARRQHKKYKYSKGTRYSSTKGKRYSSTRQHRAKELDYWSIPNSAKKQSIPTPVWLKNGFKLTAADLTRGSITLKDAAVIEKDFITKAQEFYKVIITIEYNNFNYIIDSKPV